MPTLVIRNPDGTEQEQELVQQVSVGRADGNDLILTEGGVSRRHASFVLEGKDVVVSDEGSANGTFVDGEKIEGPTKLGPRAVVVIGDYEVTVKGGAKAGAKPAGGPKKASPEEKDRATSRNPSVKGAPPRSTKVVEAVKSDQSASAALARKPRPGGATATGPVLRGLTGPWLNRTFPLRGTMTVGRVAGVDIQIEDDSVSRRHAEVVVQGKEIILRDLGSANGTTLNGAPLTEEVTLTSGDIIQFGVVEVTYEDGAPAKLARRSGAPVARNGVRGAAAGPSDEELAAAVAPSGGSKKGLVIGGSVVALALLIGALVKVTSGPDGSTVPLPPDQIPGTEVVGNIEEYLSQCRQYSSVEVGEPDWVKAAEACEKVLAQEPIHAEANALMKKIRTEKACKDNFDKGKKSMSRQRDEEAIDAFANIGNDCSYFYKAKPLIKDAIDGAKKKSGEDCKSYSQDQKWDNAAERCDRYMRFHCQTLKPADLYPPATMQLNVSTGPLRKGQWRPKDEMYLRLLRAREKVDPSAAPWVCPVIKIITPGNEGNSGPDPIAEEFKRRLRDPDLAQAVLLYFKGKTSEAEKILPKLRETREKAEFHKQAEELLRDIATVKQAYNDGSSDLRDNDPEKAADALNEALEIDERIVLGGKAPGTEEERKALLDKFKSEARRNIQQEMAAAAYQRGKGYMERQDAKHACKVWKLGYSFWRGNSDLLKAVTNVCTQRADENLKAGNCDSLKRALEFAVPGDGVAEKVPEKKAELKCP